MHARPLHPVRTSRSVRTSLRRTAVVTGTAAAALLLSAGIASAHVTVDPGEAGRGEYAKLTFRVPNESGTASTVRVRVNFPAATPLPSVRVKPHPGWTVKVTESELPRPVDVGDVRLDRAVTAVTWTAAEGSAIGPGEFDEFDVSVGPLPEKTSTSSMSFPTVQTYDDRKVVRWDQPQAPGAAEPEHPAPTLTLVAGSGGHHGVEPAADSTAASADPSAASADSTARTLGTAGLAVGILGLAAAGYAVLAVRRLGRGGAR
ncbi:YcnI family copper-binding membrane protein [Actinopolymorpha singaporensis]